MAHTIGNIDHDAIVGALVHAAALTRTRAEDVATYTPEQWADLAGRAFGVCFGSVRLGVLLGLHEVDDDIKASRRLRTGGAA
jgi:hypothetical protein